MGLLSRRPIGAVSPVPVACSAGAVEGLTRGRPATSPFTPEASMSQHRRRASVDIAPRVRVVVHPLACAPRPRARPPGCRVVRPPTHPPRHAPRAVASCLTSSLLLHITVVRRASPCCAAAHRVIVVHHPPRARPVVTHGPAGARRAVHVCTEVNIIYSLVTLFPYVSRFK